MLLNVRKMADLILNLIFLPWMYKSQNLGMSSNWATLVRGYRAFCGAAPLGPTLSRARVRLAPPVACRSRSVNERLHRRERESEMARAQGRGEGSPRCSDRVRKSTQGSRDLRRSVPFIRSGDRRATRYAGFVRLTRANKSIRASHKST